MTSVPEDNTLYYVDSDISSDIPSEQAQRNINPSGFISDKKLMIRNSYFTVKDDENGHPQESTSKIITLDDADEVNSYTWTAPPVTP